MISLQAVCHSRPTKQGRIGDSILFHCQVPGRQLRAQVHREALGAIRGVFPGHGCHDPMVETPMSRVRTSDSHVRIPRLLTSGTTAVFVLIFALLVLDRVTLSGRPGPPEFFTRLRVIGPGPPIDLVSDLVRCPVHGTPLLVSVVPIVYGYPAGPLPDSKELEAFPFGESYVLGGCCISLPTRARVSQCEQCMIDRKSWFARHWRSRFPATEPILTKESDSLGFPTPVPVALPKPDTSPETPFPPGYVDPLTPEP